MKKELTVRQVCLFFIAFMPVTKLILMPSVLSGFSEQDLWISALLTGLLDLLTIFAILKLYKKHNLSFFDLLKVHFGKTVKNIVLILYFFYFLIKGFPLLIEQKNYVNLTLYETAPTILAFLPFFFVVLLICITKVRTIGRLSDLFFLITVFSLLLVFILSLGSLDFGAILPIGAFIKKVPIASYYSLGWFGDGVYLLFFLGSFELGKKGIGKIVISYLISLTLVILFLIAFYLAFDSIAHRTLFAITDISKYSTVINNVGRVDYISVFGLLLVGTISISMPVFFETQILMEVFPFKKRIYPAIIATTLNLLLISLLNDYSVVLQNIIHTYFGGLFFMFSNLIPILLLLLRRKNDKPKN
ncbi:MAG: GerAB/ArcD/ProY family transporter [Clostridia bacterium]|nr:GerAB/ArcD/ProY family transporter [Clostridia bacterium]